MPGELECNPFAELAAQLTVFHPRLLSLERSCISNAQIELAPCSRCSAAAGGAEGYPTRSDQPGGLLCDLTFSDCVPSPFPGEPLSLSFGGAAKGERCRCPLCEYERRAEGGGARKRSREGFSTTTITPGLTPWQLILVSYRSCMWVTDLPVQEQ